ncbi:parathyroid hormone/parathyroid hormone-related peptide receptor isoform X2 [Tribolium castaneum]|uniref:parathyroid hormone/parathyroid hormone-related peptide receptor isoform X2 n=1 Tax=Tribolium castaneum TaxID=7070 RepID=UPI00077DAE05|nr:PREDICTED: parathyroid hormone/parathyroid hormone-related peptide receptor isoform X2 [Tribolium castaneum]|eukprot:XP_015834184.1 PREDICTED: parathyroid hormone/parathyroid hormone-related peptide receptor isoform X2 [Tribolium castaneum]
MTNIYVKKILDNQETARKAAKEKCISMFGPGVLQEFAEPVYNETNKTLKCPAFWDTILCWPDTPSGTVINQSCPVYVAGFLASSNATRQCMENGSWYIRDNRTWSNYSSCYKDKITTIYLDLNKTNISGVLQNYAPVVQVISETGYIVSFATLIIAFAIMLFIKKLHCARNILHMHLFASFILRALTFIVIKSTFVEGLGLPSDLNYRNGSLYFDINSETNNWACKLLTSLWQYFITANYSWILMEGLYLHNLIFRALFADSSNSIKWYVVMGWGLPLIIVGFWVAARLLVEDNLCWTTHENYDVFLIIGIPTMVSILINLLLFMRISMVLYSKLRSPINEDSRRYQKWVKSTLVLVPLFGVHYALFLALYYLIKTNKIVEVVWLFCDLLFGSFQGFFVAILYCFLNGEVKSEIQPHLYYFLTYLATNKYSKCLFPCRKKFLSCGQVLSLHDYVL